MLFLLQDKNENDTISVEIEELRVELENNPTHSYIVVNSDFFNNRDIQRLFKDAIPVGTIELVQKFLLNMHGVTHMNPIEIPKELMLEKFLLRDYQVCRYIDIPKDMYKFVKNVSVVNYRPLNF